MNDSEAQSPSPVQDQFVEKSAFDDDNDDDDFQTDSMPSTNPYEESKASGNPMKKRTLSDAMNDKGNSQKTTSGTSEGSN